MKTKPDLRIKAAATDRDSIIGGAVSNALANTAGTSPCPSAEQLAVLVDGNASEGDRDDLLGHLAVCERCRDVYLLTHELNAEEPARQSYRGWYMAGGTIAAVALVVLAVKLTVQEPVISGQQTAKATVEQTQVAQNPGNMSGSPVPTAQQEQPRDNVFSPIVAARQLAKGTSGDRLVAIIGVSKSASYGFAGSAEKESTAFRAGKELFEMELWLAAGDNERAGLAGERLIPLLRSVGGDAAATAPLNDLLRQLEMGQIDDVSRQLEALVIMPHKGIIRLGCWVAAARVAMESGKDPYFSGNPPQYFLKELDTNLSPAVRDSLGKLDKKKVGNNSAEIRLLLDKLAAEI